MRSPAYIIQTWTFTSVGNPLTHSMHEVLVCAGRRSSVWMVFVYEIYILCFKATRIFVTYRHIVIILKVSALCQTRRGRQLRYNNSNDRAAQKKHRRGLNLHLVRNSVFANLLWKSVVSEVPLYIWRWMANDFLLELKLRVKKYCLNFVIICSEISQKIY